MTPGSLWHSASLSGTLRHFLALCGTSWLFWQQSWGSLWLSLAVFLKNLRKKFIKNLRKILGGPSWLALSGIRLLLAVGSLWQRALSGSCMKNLRKKFIKNLRKILLGSTFGSRTLLDHILSRHDSDREYFQVAINLKKCLYFCSKCDYKFISENARKCHNEISHPEPGTFDSLWVSFPLSRSLWQFQGLSCTIFDSLALSGRFLVLFSTF